jgi:hypothetical protein
MLTLPHYRQSIEAHLNEVLGPALEEIGFGIKYEQLNRRTPKPDDETPF